MFRFMRKNWRTVAFWSGLGGLAAGAVVAYRKGYLGAPPAPQPIPPDALWVVLRTCPFELPGGETGRTGWMEYHLQRTQFRVWSVLDADRGGSPVYFVTPHRHVETPAGQPAEDRGESFYATVGVPAGWKRRELTDHLLADCPVVFRLCLVGGGPTGVITGDRVLSHGRLAEWEFLRNEA